MRGIKMKLNQIVKAKLGSSFLPFYGTDYKSFQISLGEVNNQEKEFLDRYIKSNIYFLGLFGEMIILKKNSGLIEKTYVSITNKNKATLSFNDNSSLNIFLYGPKASEIGVYIQNMLSDKEKINLERKVTVE